MNEDSKFGVLLFALVASLLVAFGAIAANILTESPTPIPIAAPPCQCDCACPPCEPSSYSFEAHGGGAMVQIGSDQWDRWFEDWLQRSRGECVEFEGALHCSGGKP